MSCVFCDIISGADTDVKEIARSNNSMVIVPKNPVVEGHVLVIPFRHISSVIEAPALAATDALESAIHYMREVGGDFNLITSVGPLATQTVFHLHWHIVPRRENDGLHLPWTGQQIQEETEVDRGPDCTCIPHENATGHWGDCPRGQWILRGQ